MRSTTKTKSGGQRDGCPYIMRLLFGLFAPEMSATFSFLRQLQVWLKKLKLDEVAEKEAASAAAAPAVTPAAVAPTPAAAYGTAWGASS